MTNPTPTSGAADLPEATATLIERLEDAVYEWGNYVDADHAPCPLTRHVDPHIKAIHAELQRLHAITAQAISAEQAGVPAATVIKRGADREWMSERLGHLQDGVYSLYLAAPQPATADAVKRRELVTNWFAENWAIEKAFGLLDDYDAAQREVKP